MSVGQILLIIVSVLIAAGVCQRVLDRLRLTDRQALLFVALIFIGGLVPDIPIGDRVLVNIGGAVVPFALAVYVWFRAGSAWERVRSIVASLTVAASVFAIGRFFPNEPETMFFDVNYLYGIVAGVLAYTFGRSRRCAFIAGVVGIIAADVTQAVFLWNDGVAQTLRLGGAGMLDTIVISGLAAVLTAEIIGEFLERASRGASRDKHRKLKNGEFVRSGKR